MSRRTLGSLIVVGAMAQVVAPGRITAQADDAAIATRAPGTIRSARPPTTRLIGDVIAVRGRWSSDRRTIVSDAVVQTATGPVTVTQLGGHVDGRTMALIHGPAQLAPGQRVAVAAHPTTGHPTSGGPTTGAPTTGAAASSRWLVDDVEVLAGDVVAPWVRTPTRKSRRPLYWAKSCVEVTRAVEGTAALPGDAEAAVIATSLATWNAATSSCSYLDLVDLGADDREVGNDGVNLIKFRDATWCRPAVDGDDVHCFSPQASGITTLLFVDDVDDDRDGEIIDADIELNGVDFAISTGGMSQSMVGCQADLGNTLVHELGHLLGLAHTCLGPADVPRPDGDGQPVPLCGPSNGPTIIEATMYPFQACGETSKVSLTADDGAALCAIYPTTRDPGVCEGPDELGGGCCDQGAGGGGAVGLALVTLAMVSTRRRRA